MKSSLILATLLVKSWGGAVRVSAIEDLNLIRENLHSGSYRGTSEQSGGPCSVTISVSSPDEKPLFVVSIRDERMQVQKGFRVEQSTILEPTLKVIASDVIELETLEAYMAPLKYFLTVSELHDGVPGEVTVKEKDNRTEAERSSLRCYSLK